MCWLRHLTFFTLVSTATLPLIIQGWECCLPEMAYQHKVLKTRNDFILLLFPIASVKYASSFYLGCPQSVVSQPLSPVPPNSSWTYSTIRLWIKIKLLILNDFQYCHVLQFVLGIFWFFQHHAWRYKRQAERSQNSKSLILVFSDQRTLMNSSID